MIFDTGVTSLAHICDPLFWPCQGDASRAAIDEKLEHTPGKHLIIVRYCEDHNIHDEWVYNGAEIDDAKVLWAREINPEQNAKLFAYFKDRKIWLVTPDTRQHLPRALHAARRRRSFRKNKMGNQIVAHVLSSLKIFAFKNSLRNFPCGSNFLHNATNSGSFS